MRSIIATEGAHANVLSVLVRTGPRRSVVFTAGTFPARVQRRRAPVEMLTVGYVVFEGAEKLCGATGEVTV